MKGFAVPVQIEHGRVRIADTAEKMHADVVMALLDGDSDNPFNEDVGIDPPVWRLNDHPTKSIVKRQIATRFRRFEKDQRARLEKVDVSDGIEAGTMDIAVQYRDLELDSNESVRQTSGS